MDHLMIVTTSHPPEQQNGEDQDRDKDNPSHDFEDTGKHSILH